MASGARNLIYILTLIALMLSLAIPLYGIPTGLVALFRRSPYSRWPSLLVTLCWVAQWPAISILAFALPGAPSIGGDGEESFEEKIKKENKIKLCRKSLKRFLR